MRLRATGLVKTFPGVRALDGVALTLEPGAVHALLGENGAGKSTLIKILTGVHLADTGIIDIASDGSDAWHTVSITSPQDAAAAGIGVVHQERNLVPAFSVAENIALQELPHRRGLAPAPRARNCLRG